MPKNNSNNFKWTEAAVHRCSSKKVFLKILRYSKENTCVGVSFSCDDTKLTQKGENKCNRTCHINDIFIQLFYMLYQALYTMEITRSCGSKQC